MNSLTLLFECGVEVGDGLEEDEVDLTVVRLEKDLRVEFTKF